MTLPLFPYQHVGADFLAAKHRGALFDVMGVGKTAQAIGACDRVNAKRIIVVCPAAVREVWAGEFRKFSPLPRKVIKGKTIGDLGMWLKGRADVLLLSYEMASKWTKKIEGDIFDALILDEGHYLKNAETARTRAILGTHCDGKAGLGQWAARTWILTGTPMSNDPVDIWPLLRFMGGTQLNLSPFTARYFKSRMGTFSSRQEPRDEMVPELRQAIRAVSLRRTKEEVGLQLPPIWLTTTTIEGDTAEIRELLREWPGLEQAILDAIEQGGLSFIEAQHVATLRRLVGQAKAPAYGEMLVEELKNGKGKTVVGGIHLAAMDTVRQCLNDAGIANVTVNGSTTEARRVEAVAAFQNDPDVKVFLGNLRAAGTGLTLTAAADIDLFESSWSPADNAQFLMRCHRISQTRTVQARFISLANSIDDVVTETVARKTAAIAKIEA